MNILDRFAPFYDLEYAGYREDVEMYRQLARWCAPEGSERARVLEPACGTGRVLLDLAEEGHECTGVDASEAMLLIARRYAEERGLKVHLAHGQMQDRRVLGAPESFDLAICALNSFAYLAERQAQIDALRVIHDALRHGGLAALDLAAPGNAAPFPAQGEVVLQGRWPYQSGEVVKLVSGSWDPAMQIHYVNWIYDQLDAEGFVRRTIVEQRMRYVYPAEAELLVERAGMRVEAVYGTYELDPFDSASERMIVLARRTD